MVARCISPGCSCFLVWSISNYLLSWWQPSSIICREASFLVGSCLNMSFGPSLCLKGHRLCFTAFGPIATESSIGPAWS